MRLSMRISSLLSIAALLLLAGSAEGGAAPKAAYSLTVSPTRLIVPASRSQATHVFDVSNTGTKSLRVETTFSDIAQGRSGTLSFAPGGPFSATNWVKATPENFQLIPGQHQKVRVSVTVPPHPEPGEHQVGMVFRVPPKKGSGNLAVSGAIGSEILIGVPGKVVREVALSNLDAPTFSNGGTTPLTLTIRNLGNVHREYLAPHRLVARVNGERVAFPDFSVLRDSVRTVTTDWTDPPLLCLCTVTVSTDDGQGHTVRARARIIVFPFALAAGTLIMAIGLGLLLRGQHRRSRRKLNEVRNEAYDQARRELTTVEIGK